MTRGEEEMQLPLPPPVCFVTDVCAAFTVCPGLFIVVSTFLPPLTRWRMCHTPVAHCESRTEKLAQYYLISMTERQTPAWFLAARI